MTTVSNIHIGTSGWHYKHWSGPFYPADMRSEDYLAFYCQHFHTVEINNSFYQLPDESTLEDWQSHVPDGFVFAVKASRYITHMKKLKDPQEPVGTFMQRIAALKDRLGPILFQLPPHWHANPERLENFLQTLPKGHRFTFEFRDESWFDELIYEILRKHNAAFCMYYLEGKASPKEVTADFVYIRLHGAERSYQGKYTTSQLAGWAGAISAWSRMGKEVYCYFNNDIHAAAPENAAELNDMLMKN
jgi:uncharacterized protein YecE (DUF72 family)